MIHFCSRSIILEFQKDPSLPLYKYLLKNFNKDPFFNVNIDRNDKNTLPLVLYASRIIEVPVNASAPKPYIQHNAKQLVDVLKNEWFEVSINIDFQDVAEFY
jgi:hypothetical protein